MAYCKGRPTTSEWTRPSSRRWRKHGALFGHPASRMLTINENVIEVENARTYVAGPGRTPVRAIDPQTRRTEPVAIDLLPPGWDGPR